MHDETISCASTATWCFFMIQHSSNFKRNIHSINDSRDRHDIDEFAVMMFLKHHKVVPGKSLQLTNHVFVMSQLCNLGKRSEKNKLVGEVIFLTITNVNMHSIFEPSHLFYPIMI